MRWAKAGLAALAYLAAAALVLAGAAEVWRDVYASWYQDGGVFYEDSGLEVIFSPKPIRIGDVLLDWQGPVMFLLGVLLAAAVYQVSQKS